MFGLNDLAQIINISLKIFESNGLLALFVEVLLTHLTAGPLRPSFAVPDFGNHSRRDPLLSEDIDLLRKFWDSGFRDRLQSGDPAKSPIKIWDGFTFTLDNGGGWITFGKSFRYWISFG